MNLHAARSGAIVTGADVGGPGAFLLSGGKLQLNTLDGKGPPICEAKASDIRVSNGPSADRRAFAVAKKLALPDDNYRTRLIARLESMTNQSLARLLVDSDVSIADGRVNISAKFQFHADRFENERNFPAMVDAIREEFGVAEFWVCYGDNELHKASPQPDPWRLQKEREEEALLSRRPLATLGPDYGTMPYAEYLRTDRWRRTRIAALKRADFRCQVCNSGDTTLDVHHRTYERRGQEQDSDLIVLCRACHDVFHKNGRVAQ